MLVDTHCHLGASQFDDDRDEILGRSHSAGVEHVVVIADSKPASDRAIALASRPGLSATAGVHPHEASSWTPEIQSEVEELLHQECVVAVGETGLDYHYDHSPRDIQRRAFADQLVLGTRHSLPVVIHSRSADDDIAAMIRDTDARCILHSFSSGERVLRAGLDRDAYFSFSGMITFKSWKGVDAVQAVPTERLLVETDAPYLAPVPYRGQRNEPAFVVRVAERLAELRGSTVEDMISSTTANAVRLFGDRVTQSTITL